MGKEMGSYLTLEVPGLRKKGTLLQDRVIRAFYKELQQLFNLNGNQSVLVVGLGNWNVTPDDLGPRVVKVARAQRDFGVTSPYVLAPRAVKELLITRHTMQLEAEMAEEGYRPVGACTRCLSGDCLLRITLAGKRSSNRSKPGAPWRFPGSTGSREPPVPWKCRGDACPPFGVRCEGVKPRYF